jgi:hypothetical protein
MQTEDNDGGGLSVFLIEGDSLDQVPDSHQKLITPTIREVFADPPAHFRGIADICPFPQMAKWLRALLNEEEWMLALHQGDPPEWTSVGFSWASSKVRGADIAPSSGVVPAALSAPLRQYYSLVDEIRWMSFGNAGGLDDSRSQTPLSTFGDSYVGPEILKDKAYVLGWSPCGDMLVYTEKNQGGWRSHETGQLHFLGTIEETIDWVFGELLADRCPDIDYSWFR